MPKRIKQGSEYYLVSDDVEGIEELGENSALLVQQASGDFIFLTIDAKQIMGSIVRIKSTPYKLVVSLANISPKELFWQLCTDIPKHPTQVRINNNAWNDSSKLILTKVVGNSNKCKLTIIKERK